MRRLSSSTLAAVPAHVRRPGYDRNRLDIGMAHIGVGAFHRCHQSEFTDDMLEKRFGPWGEVGINLRPPLLTETLGAQDGLYTRTLREGTTARTRVIGAMRRVIDAGDTDGAEAAIVALASPSVQVVTMTITEKAYCRVPSTGKIDWSNPGLLRDRDGDGPPATVHGLLARALERRKIAGASGLTLISCDNVPSNGTLLGSVLTEFIASRSADLARWVERNVAFPSTMVDRIVPATMASDLAYASEAIGIGDEAAVVGEPFRQWVIEDRFAGDRPPWDLAGVQFVANVEPYELIKMRVLNAAQSTLSHLGAVLGHTYSYEAAADPVLERLTREMLERETSTTLPELPDMPVAPYIETSMRRIQNTAIRHRCHQIGTDGSQKIVQRLLNPLRERMAQGHAPGLLALGVASWMAYALCGSRRFGTRWRPDDPLAERVIGIGNSFDADFRTLARTMLGIEEIFGTDLAGTPAETEMAAHLEGLLGSDPNGYLSIVVSRM
jgi:fructuronate reductase